ncbi:MAG TPA: DUF2309 domain-containing protein [Saprospiraceae bacterium]|nr:DUF2309 domain-containing protein [Saprospiraceae bacterium]HRK82135.1 DUF2309 domain-containing protein [Saprospiraceae bacterium]
MEKHSSRIFNEAHVLHQLEHYLPSQTPLKDFVHHNSLHAFQDQKFYDAIFKASKMFGFQVTIQLNEFRKLYKINRIRREILESVIKERKGEQHLDAWLQKALQQQYDYNIEPRIGRLRALWKSHYHIDLDNLVQPLLFRILCSFLDQGVALWNFPFEEKGLLGAIRTLEQNSFAGFIHGKRARKLLMDSSLELADLLKIVAGDEAFFEQYLFDQQFAHRGWSGMVATVEHRPESLLYAKNISLRELIHLELIMEIDALDRALGTEKWQPLALVAQAEPMDLFAEAAISEFHEVLMIWQDAFEWSYYDEVLAGLQHLKGFQSQTDEDIKDVSFQAIFCIDEREDSLRRHIEMVDKRSETLGAPGFFGVEFFFQPSGGKFYEKLCPAPVTPKYLIKEKETGPHHRKRELLYTKRSHTMLQGFVITLSLGLWAAVKLFLDLFRPKMSPAISDAFAHMNMDAELQIESADPPTMENGLQLGFTVTEMADRVENLLRGIGMAERFARIVYMVGHGSSSANNPHHGAHDCGACSGRPGAVNARVFAFMANHAKVRELLSARGMHIPAGTRFVGALHDTAADEIAFYDADVLPQQLAKAHEQHQNAFEEALNLNAKERSRRFASIDTQADIKKVREAIRRRSVSYFEPRPELGHGTNALCFVGHRGLTKGLFFDRRAFMNSYDYRTDPDGRLLLNVIRPLPIVCGGINLEYYFSRVDNYKLGAGTKLPHNVMGLIGVANSSDGDLRPGLPLQMIEVHDPVRLLILVEHYPDVVLKTIGAQDDLYDWFKDEWVHLVAIHPDTNDFYYFKNEAFYLYKPVKESVERADDVHYLLESAKEMETNYIVDATQENLPVHILTE